MEIKTIEIGGFVSAFKALHLPYYKDSSIIYETKIVKEPFFNKNIEYSSTLLPSDKDLNLIQKLIKNGDEHAKIMRGIVVWCEINAPIYFWWDLETYVVGHQRLCSESTMNAECKGLTGEELQKVKGNIKFGRMVKKIDYFSYQTLRRIYFQRKNHRLPEFKQFCEWIETLPYSKELITVK